MATKKVTRRRRYFSRGRANGPKRMTVPVAVALGFAPLLGNVYTEVKTNGWANGLRNSVTTLVPYDFSLRKLDFSKLGSGLYPIIAGLAVHKLIGSMLGVNRALARSGIPYIRL